MFNREIDVRSIWTEFEMFQTDFTNRVCFASLFRELAVLFLAALRKEQRSVDDRGDKQR